MANYVMGIDVGTTGAKSMVIDLQGNVLGKAYREYPLEYPKPDWVEIRASYLIEQVFDTVKEAIEKSKVDPKDIKAISFSLQRATFCMHGEDLEPINDTVYVWLDNRAAEIMDEMATKIDPHRQAHLSGMPTSCIYTVEKLYWLKKFQPEIYNATKYCATIDAFVMHKFGADNFCTEVTNTMVSGMIDVNTFDWCDEILDALELDKSKLAPLVDPSTIVGRIKEDVAKRTGLAVGTLIVAGCGDQQAAAMGAGVTEDGAMSLTLGTVGELVVGLAKPDFVKLEGLMIPSTANKGVFEIEGNQISGATCYRWCRDTLCPTEAALADAMGVDAFDLMGNYIRKSKPGANGVIFYAGIFGTGHPTWNPKATGVYVGLKSSNSRADMVRAVMEGITLESRFIYEAIKETGVHMKNEITVTGGAFKSPEWCQIVADVMNCTLKMLKVSDAAIIGVAIQAAVAAGLFKDLAEGVKSMVQVVDEVKPIPENVEVYNRVFPIYKDVYYGLNDRKVFERLSEIN